MTNAKGLLETLDLEAIEVNLFRGFSPRTGHPRVFGGQVLGQALVAAGRTVEGRAAHSLHAYFLRPGDPEIPILYEVDRIRDGRSFTTRRVRAIQRGEAIFNMSASFQIDEAGLEHQFEMPERPGPEELVTDAEYFADKIGQLPPALQGFFRGDGPIELRGVEPVDYFEPQKRAPYSDVWFRCRTVLPEDPALHQCVLAYASDFTLLDTSIMPHGVSWFSGALQSASLDHSLWFHRSFRADEWHLYHQDSPSTAGGRGFNRASVFARDGRLVASVAQEGLIRMRASDPGQA